MCINTRGFILFYAVIVSGVLLTIALAVLNLYYRELLITGFSRESPEAFHAADTGAECVLFHDNIRGLSGMPPTPFSATSPVTQIRCDGADWTLTRQSVSGGCSVSGVPPTEDTVVTFQIDSAVKGSCADVTVRKICTVNDAGTPGDPSDDFNNITTLFTSKGYNAQCGVDHPRKVERLVEVRY